MNAVEIMTSESQERMLAIVTPANLDEVLALCERWEIRATVIGRVTDSARFRVYEGLFDAIGVPGENPPPPVGAATSLEPATTGRSPSRGSLSATSARPCARRRPAREAGRPRRSAC